MEIYTTSHNNHLITTEKGTQFGIFFRSPIQKVSYDAYYNDYPKTSAWTYKNKIKNPSDVYMRSSSAIKTLLIISRNGLRVLTGVALQLISL